MCNALNDTLGNECVLLELQGALLPTGTNTQLM